MCNSALRLPQAKSQPGILGGCGISVGLTRVRTVSAEELASLRFLGFTPTQLPGPGFAKASCSEASTASEATCLPKAGFLLTWYSLALIAVLQVIVLALDLPPLHSNFKLCAGIAPLPVRRQTTEPCCTPAVSLWSTLAVSLCAAAAVRALALTVVSLALLFPPPKKLPAPKRQER